MDIIIVGAGAMGGLVGGLLTESGMETVLYDVSSQRIDAIRQNGLVIEREGRKRSIKVNATTRPDELKTADLLCVLVKSYDTREALWAVQRSIGPETKVITLQNGLGNVEAISDIVPAGQILAGVTSHGAMLLRPGVIRHNGGAKTYIGSLTGEKEETGNIAQILTHAGMETFVSDDMDGVIWTKLVANAGINPLTAISGLHNGELLDSTDMLDLMEKIVGEAVRVAADLKICLQEEDMFSYVQSVCRATAQNKSSMLMDVLNGRRTEIDAINGMIVKKAAELKISAPVNETVTALVRALHREC